MRRSHSLFPTLIVTAVVLALLAGSTVSARESIADTISGFRVLSGRDAAGFRLPADVRLVRTWRDARHGLTYSRYQQYERPYDALVDGAQLTIVRRGSVVALVIGAHFPSVAARNRLVVDGQAAIGRAHADKTLHAKGGHAQPDAPDLQHRTELRLDPLSGRLFQRVESAATGTYFIHEIDAETGAVIDAWDAIDHASPGGGTGVKGDRKSLLGGAGGADNLTRQVSGVWRMQTVDIRLATLDARGKYFYSTSAFMTDNAKPAWANDNDWIAGAQRGAVDAQYYGRLTDDFYLDPSNVGGFDLVADCATAGYGPLRTVVRFDETPNDGFGYDNAFFDGFSGDVVFGDGDGVTTRGFAGAQDIVSHEMSHRVTECRAPLDYSHQSGALNEAFSDIMATAMEWEFSEPTSSLCRREQGQAVCADWWVGEDAIVGGSDFGFRNLSDPESAGQPSHWEDRSTSSFDNHGVHINSTIPSHAFYLMANGGRNARCSGPTDSQADCDVLVPAIPIADATQIMFAAWGTLTTSASFCEAHDDTLAAAELLFPGSELHRAAAELAWAAVGRGEPWCHSADALQIDIPVHSLALAPGGSGQLTVTTTGATDVTISGGAPANVVLNGSTLEITTPADMPHGIYPILISASDGSVTKFGAVVLAVDSEAPDVGVDSVSLARTGQVSSSGVVPVQVKWSAHDDGSGVVDAALESDAGGSWGALGTPMLKGGTETLLAAGTGYSFRAHATDAVGNSATSPDSGPWQIGRFQEGSVAYRGAWSALAGTQNWGSVRYSTTYGAIAKFSFNGTDVAWISSRGPRRGKAKIYLDGLFMTKVDLYAATTSGRRISFVANGLIAGPHVLKVLVLGTSGRPRIDIEGFVVLSQ